MKTTAAIEAGIAPRMAAGWAAAFDVLADRAWHSYTELEQAITGTGLAARSANNLLRDARADDWVVKERRGVNDTWWRLS